MLLKSLPGRLKIALASPLFPPSADEVEAERKAKVARWKRKAAALQHLMNLQPDRARGIHLLPVGIQGWELRVKQGTETAPPDPLV